MPKNFGKTVNRGRKAGGYNWKTIIRIEKAVALEAAGLSDAEIVLMTGLSSAAALATMKRSPMYQAVRLRVKSGVTSELEQGLGQETAYLRTKIQESLPQALQVLVDNLKNPDPKVRSAAANDLLDRDGKLAKVTRTGLPTEEQGGVGDLRFDTTIADNLIDLLSGKGTGNGSQEGNANDISNKLPA